MKRKYSLGLLALLAMATGSAWFWYRSQYPIPNNPDELIIFSIDGTQLRKEPENRQIPEGSEVLYGCPVFGKVVVTDPEQRREIVAAVKADIRSGSEGYKMCFVPRHVLRTVKNGKAVDLQICFECNNYCLYRDGQIEGEMALQSGKESKALLNKVLAKAGVLIAP